VFAVAGGLRGDVGRDRALGHPSRDLGPWLLLPIVVGRPDLVRWIKDPAAAQVPSTRLVVPVARRLLDRRLGAAGRALPLGLSEERPRKERRRARLVVKTDIDHSFSSGRRGLAGS
jgi:hypothetical protein